MEDVKLIEKKLKKSLKTDEIESLSPGDCFNILKLYFSLICHYQDIANLEMCCVHSRSALRYLKRIKLEELNSDSDQYDYCRFIVVSSEHLAFTKDDEDEVIRTGVKETVTGSEKRVKNLLEKLETSENELKLNKDHYYEIIGRCCIVLGKLYILKDNLTYLHESEKLLERAENNFYGRIPRLYNVSRSQHSAAKLSFCSHYEKMIDCKKNPGKNRKYFRKKSNKAIQRKVRKGKSLMVFEEYNIKELRSLIRRTAKEAMKIIFPTKKFFQPSDVDDGDVKEIKKRVEDITCLADLFSQLGWSYYYLDRFEKAMDFSDKCIKLILSTYGTSYSIVLREAYSVKLKIYQKLGRKDMVLKMVKLIEKGNQANSNFKIPMDEMIMASSISKARKKLEKELKREEDLKNGKYQTEYEEPFLPKWGKFRKHRRICSNPSCENMERKKGGKKFKRCSRCKSAFYCCRKCQLYHWKNGHKYSCSLDETKD